MSKWFQQIAPADTDEISWKGKDGKVTVTVADQGDGKWVPVLKGKKGFYIVKTDNVAKKEE